MSKTSVPPPTANRTLAFTGRGTLLLSLAIRLALNCSYSGKGLGGSSSINFLYWTRPQKEEIDSESPFACFLLLGIYPNSAAMEQLGNPGWNWERFYKASKRSET